MNEERRLDLRSPALRAAILLCLWPLCFLGACGTHLTSRGSEPAVSAATGRPVSASVVDGSVPGTSAGSEGTAASGSAAVASRVGSEPSNEQAKDSTRAGVGPQRTSRGPSCPEGASTIQAVLFLPEGRPPARVDVEVVDTPEGVARGLMFRKHLAESRGMLFLLPVFKRHSFWMKNTFIPLSLAFIDDDMRVIDIHLMKPLDDGPRYTASRPCRYALEVNRGWFRRHGVKPGCRVAFLADCSR